MMEYNIKAKEIIVNRKENLLDKFVLDFVSLLDNYVIVSGYVSILFGRSRATEDVDLLIPELTIEDFKKLWDKIHKKNFECLNTSKINEAYDMLKSHAIRFSYIGKPIPNMEFKIMKTSIEKYSYENKIKAKIKDKIIFISPIETQIAYKLYLGSNKDLEDAKHLYILFKENINKDELHDIINKLNVKEKFDLIK